MFDLDPDVRCDLPIGVADRQVDTTKCRPAARFDLWSADADCRFLGGDLDQLEFLELFLFRLRPRGRAGAGLVLGDELFEVLHLRQHARVDAFLVLASFLLVLPMGVDLARVHRQLSAREVERVVAGRAQKRPIVRDDQAGLVIMSQEVLEQDLGAQVEKVRGFVEQQQVWRMEQSAASFTLVCHPPESTLIGPSR